jgi:hypothetical protein
MSKTRRQNYNGCSVESHGGWLRLRFRVTLADGRVKHVARAMSLPATAENKRQLEPIAKLIGAALNAGRSLEEIDGTLKGSMEPVSPEAPSPSRMNSPTLEEFYKRWIPQQEPLVRKAQFARLSPASGALRVAGPGEHAVG